MKMLQKTMNFSELALLLRFPYQSEGELTLVDVGAHIGTSAYPFTQKGWRVIAFEPEPENRRELENNLRNCQNATIIPKAVSDRAGQEIPFYVSSEHWGIHSLKPFHDSHQPELTVETVRLDTTLTELGVEQVSLLKIDVEGADFLALQSFDFSKMQPEIVMCEFMDERSQKNFGYSHHDMARYMQERGYDIFICEWAAIKEYARKDKATASHQFIRCSPYPLNYQPAWGNLIFVRGDRLEEFEKNLSDYYEELKPPAQLDELLELVKKAKEQQDFQSLISLLRTIVGHYPQHVPSLVLLSDLLLQKRNIEEARAVLSRAQKTFPESEEIAKRVRTLFYQEEQEASLKKSHQQLVRFKDKHKGERCVIIGNGPSLNKMDLSFLKHEICFGLNRIYLGFEKWGFVPSYYVSVNQFVIHQSADEIRQIPCPKFVSVAGYPSVTVEDDLMLINSIYCKDLFSKNPEEGFNIGATVTYVTMQLAYYMGFETVILIGVDHKFATKGTPHKLIESQGDDPNHFDPSYFGKGTKWQLPDLPASEMMYKLAEAFYKADGRQIIDATLDGHCPVFEKRNYKELFFKQNGEVKVCDRLLSMPVNEICAYSYQYQKDQTNPSVLAKLRQGRQQIAERWISLSDKELESAYAGNLGRVHKALLNTRIKDELQTEKEQNFVSELATEIARGGEQPKIIKYLLATMLYLRADQIKYDLSCIPQWLLNDYIKFTFAELHYFQTVGEADSYRQHMAGVVDYLHRQVLSNPESEQWQKIATYFTKAANLIPLHVNNANLKEIYAKRAEILEWELKNQNLQIDWEFPERSPDAKIRIGVLASDFTPHQEIFTTLPAYKHLNRDLFEIILYSLKTTNHRLERYCAGHADTLIKLPSDLQGQVQTIREAELDILFISTNVTGVTHPVTLLALHRLARMQMVDANSPVTTGMRHVDYYISSKLSEPENDAQQHYTETLIKLDSPPQCFDFATESQLLATTSISRESLGIGENTIVYISGATIDKIIPEVEAAWVKIIAKVPNSVLLLYPFNPNWSSSYPVVAFRKRITATFAKHNLSEDRLIILDAAPNRADVKERLKLADIYLDSYPYSGMTSPIDPLEVGLPTVVLEGECSRSRKGASLLRSLQIFDLIASSEEAYIQLAIELGTNWELREQKSAQIEQKMQENPRFLDSRDRSAQMGALFQELCQKYQTDTLNKNFRLRDINLIIFPDWNGSEESLYQDLASAIMGVATHPDKNQITLLIDTTDISSEDADAAISSVVMNLLMSEDLDVDDGPEITLIGQLSDMQWELLLSRIHSRIGLENENHEAIARVNATNLPCCELDNLPNISFLAS